MKLANKLLTEALTVDVQTVADAYRQYELIEAARKHAIKRGQKFLAKKAERIQAQTAVKRLRVFKLARDLFARIREEKA